MANIVVDTISLQGISVKRQFNKTWSFFSQRRGNLLPKATKCRAAVARVVGLSVGKLYNQGRALYVIRGSGMESIRQNCMESSQKMAYAYRQFHTRQAVMPYQAFWLE